MQALVVYESMFGNSERVAGAIADGLSRRLDVEVVEVADAPARITGLLDLIVVGGPTHAFSMTRPATREDAVRQGARGQAARGIREWLERLPDGPHSELVATFDTRVDKVRRLPGSAAKSAAKVLRRRGYGLATKPTSFYVEGVDGPLLPGELNRARDWGDRLAQKVLTSAGVTS